MENKKKYKLYRKMCPLLLVGSLITMTSCANNTKNYTVSYREKDYLSFMLNPLDWTYEPDIVRVKGKDEDKVIEVEYSIEEFNNLINSEKDYIELKNENTKVSINREELKQWSETVLNNTLDPLTIAEAKIIMTIFDGTVLMTIITGLYMIHDALNKSKTKKLMN